MSVQEVAARCLRDAAFARSILAGDEYPEVRGAILADLQAASEVQGFLNPQATPPGGAQTFVLGIDRSWSRWNGLTPMNLARLAGTHPPP